jgi:hypothetical protein
MTQKRHYLFLFCVFFIFLPTTAPAQINSNLLLFKNFQPCSNSLISKFFPIHDVVTSTYSNWNWPPTEIVNPKASLLIELDNHLFFFGLQNLKKELSFSKLEKNDKIKNICINKNSKLPFLYIQTTESKLKKKDNGFYSFLHQGIKDEYEEFSILKDYFGSILYTNLEMMTGISFVTLEIKLTHEAIHLFGQSELQSSSPEFRAVNVVESKLPEEISSLESMVYFQNCNELSNTLVDMSSREYLQYKEKCSPMFKELVQNEICLDYKLIQIILNNRVPDESSRKEIHSLLSEIIDILRKRTALHDDGGLQLEWYWYLLEGVPQYVEQKISLKKYQDRIEDHYKSYCLGGEDHVGIFYPLLTGAAIWHGLEYIFDSRSEWEELAMPTEYNVKYSEFPEAWFEKFQAILDRFSKKININTLNGAVNEFKSNKSFFI